MMHILAMPVILGRSRWALGDGPTRPTPSANFGALPVAVRWLTPAQRAKHKEGAATCNATAAVTRSQSWRDARRG